MLPNVLQPSATDHVPVLANEVRESLGVQPGETVVDATFGAGGHAALLAGDLQGRGKLIAIDRDPTARTYFERFEKHASVQSRLLRGDFSVVLPQLAENGVQADAILLDLGVSSMQLDRPERGFSYSVDAPLDMRMDTSQDLTAADIVNEWPERELVTIFRKYGEERYAKQIVRAILRTRSEQPFERTGELVDTIKSCDSRAGALRRRPSGQARLPGAAHRGQRRARLARGGACRRRSRCCGPAAGSPSSRSTRSRTASSSSSSARRSGAARARRTSRCACAVTSPSCVRSSAGRSGRARPSWLQIRGPRRRASVRR